MNPRWWWPAAVALAVLAGLVLTVCGWRWASAAWTVARARAQHQSAAGELSQILTLRASARQAVVERVPEGELVGRLQRTLAKVNLPATALSGIQPDSDQRDPASAIRTRRMTARLIGLRPGDLGAFLVAWRTPDQPWSVEGIALVHPADRPSGLDPDRFEATLTLVARSLE